VKRTSRRRIATAGLAGPGLALVVGLSGCSGWAESITTIPYQAADGTNGQIGGFEGNGGLKLRNFLLVSEEENAPGVLVGAILNEGSRPVEVRLQVEAGQGDQSSALTQETVTAQPGVLLQLGVGSGDTFVQVPRIPQPPGSVLSLSVSTPDGGTQLALPVLAPVNEYASITPSARPSPSQSATGVDRSPTVSPSETSPGAPGTTETATPTQPQTSPSPS
jgi:hypothetical protein